MLRCPGGCQIASRVQQRARRSAVVLVVLEDALMYIPWNADRWVSAGVYVG
jgi:hypothetical protein